jgi:hypothetical protein
MDRITEIQLTIKRVNEEINATFVKVKDLLDDISDKENGIKKLKIELDELIKKSTSKA